MAPEKILREGLTMPDRIRVAVIDDHPLFREGVSHVIRNSKALEFVAEGGCADDAVRIAKHDLPDIVLLDVNIPGCGLEAARKIARACPVVKVVLLTVSESEDDVGQALAAGVQGYVLKGTSGQELINALWAISQGGSYVSPGLAARLLTGAKRSMAAALERDAGGLTKREQSILDLVSVGKTNKEVARALGITDKTVKHYMTNIMQKLQVRNRVEAVIASRKIVSGRSQAAEEGQRQLMNTSAGLQERRTPPYRRVA